jgi:hypothetical protein
VTRSDTGSQRLARRDDAESIEEGWPKLMRQPPNFGFSPGDQRPQFPERWPGPVVDTALDLRQLELHACEELARFCVKRIGHSPRLTFKEVFPHKRPSRSNARHGPPWFFSNVRRFAAIPSAAAQCAAHRPPLGNVRSPERPSW